jgi:hypothetical protein
MIAVAANPLFIADHHAFSVVNGFTVATVLACLLAVCACQWTLYSSPSDGA